MTKRRGKKQSRSQQALWLISMVMVASMVISLIIVALPHGRPAPTPTPVPLPTFTPLPSPTLGVTAAPSPSPQATEPAAPVALGGF